MYFGLIVPAYGYGEYDLRDHNLCGLICTLLAYFAPAIIQNLGHSSIRTQLFSVPPWAAAFAVAMIIATISDRVGHRYLFTLLPQGIALAGFGILFSVHNRPNLEYAALFLAAAGTYSSMPVIVCWCATNCTFSSVYSIVTSLTSDKVAGHRRRSVGLGWQIGFGNSECAGIYRSSNTEKFGLSRWYHRCLLFPRPGWAEVQARLQHLPVFHLPVSRVLPRLFLLHLQREPQARSCWRRRFTSFLGREARNG